VVDCSNNQLTTIDVSQNNPYQVICNNNQLTNIDLSGIKNHLWDFEASSNKLSTIDFSNCVSLTTLYLVNNLFTNINVGPNSASITVLGITDNPWDYVLTPFDATQYPSLQYLYCSSISSSNVDLSNCKNLRLLQAYNDTFSTLDVNPCSSSLIYLDCSINSNLTTLNVSNCNTLQYISCHQNSLSSLIISGSSLNGLICSTNNLTVLDIGNCPSIISMSCGYNLLSSSVVNQILVDLDSFGLTNGNLNMSGSNQVPTSGGITARTNLVNKGWLVKDSSETYI
jgi:hypothetical protein